jgi:hypothetical protein
VSLRQLGPTRIFLPEAQALSDTQLLASGHQALKHFAFELAAQIARQYPCPVDRNMTRVQAYTNMRQIGFEWVVDRAPADMVAMEIVQECRRRRIARWGILPLPPVAAMATVVTGRQVSVRVLEDYDVIRDAYFCRADVLGAE